MKINASILLLGLILMLCSCNKHTKTNNAVTDTLSKPNNTHYADIEDVSLIKLLGDSKEYNGRKVRVIGYLNLEFEGNCLYVHKEDYDRSIYKNGLWVAMSRDSIRLPAIKKCIKQYVVMEGTFDANNLGHRASFSGAIKNVTRLEVW